MKTKLKNLKTYLVYIFASVTISTLLAFTTVQAACVNQVPNPLNPDCDPSKDISFGNLTDRILGIIPLGVTFVAIAAVVRGAFKIMTSDDTEGRQDGFKVLINASIGVGVFYSIWIILYFIEQITGAQLIYFS